MSEAVVFTECSLNDGRRIGVAQLNAPRGLNALSLEMIRLLTPRLDQWARDPEIAAVWLEGSGDKAFCAGGDVLALYRAMAEGRPEDGDPFFAEEYRLDYTIHCYPKPLLVWGNGIVMGGGLGLMAGAAIRIVTEKSHIAMPEIGIGLFPDVGASWFLNRMPGRTGLFLGLTGAPLNAADALFLNLADRFIAHEQKAAVLQALCEADWKGHFDIETINGVLRDFEADREPALPESQVRAHFDQIQRLTDVDDLSELVQQIADYKGEDRWLQQAAANVRYGSPTSMAVFNRQLGRARHASLAEAFREEYSLAHQALRAGEFAEGIRALLVDKDRQPRWRYSSIVDLEADWLEQFFLEPEGRHPLDDLK